MRILDLTKKLDFVKYNSVHLSALMNLHGPELYTELLKDPEFVLKMSELYEEASKWQAEVMRAQMYNAEPILKPSRALDPEAEAKLNAAFQLYLDHLRTRFATELDQLMEEVTR
jgi:hypothetical protein